MSGLADYPSVICAWCDKVLDTSPRKVAMVSHGICPTCDATLLKTPEPQLEARIQKALTILEGSNHAP